MNKTSTILLSTITALTLLLSTTGCTDSNSSAPKVTVDGVEYDLLHLTQQEIEDILLNFSLEQLTELVTQVQAMYDEALDKYSDSISDLAKEALDNVKALLAQKQAIVNAENEAEKQKAQEEADAKAAQLAANVKALADEAKKAETPPSVKKEVEKVIEVIEPSNEKPIAKSDLATTAYMTAVTVDVLANDYDPDGDTLVVTSLRTNPSFGTAVIEADSKITYTPEAGFANRETFTYIVSDGNGNTVAAPMTIIVGEKTNNAPVGVDDEVTVNANDTVLFNPVSNDTDGDGDKLTPELKTDPSHGTLEKNPDGTLKLDVDGKIKYTPNADYVGSDSFEYFAVDPSGEKSEATMVTISVEPTGGGEGSR